MGLAQQGNEDQEKGKVTAHRGCKRCRQAAARLVLEGLGQPEREAHNRRQARPRDRISDPVLVPFPPIIGALNSYLHAYHMYRAEAYPF